MEIKPNNCFVVKSPFNNGDFYKAYLTMLYPFHKMSIRTVEVAAAFLQKRYELSKIISSQDLLNTTLFSSKVKKEIREKLNMNKSNFFQQINLMRVHKFFIDDNIINPRYIPNVDDHRDFVLSFVFRLGDGK
ncbi:MAG: hypothetical protein J6N78_00375 [Clostridia bacterium]|nr:hypothetical protein [Clostridia bacterium]